MIFRGREQLYRDIGRQTFNDIAAKLDDVGKLERDIKIEVRRMIMIMVPKGPPKKHKGPQTQTSAVMDDSMLTEPEDNIDENDDMEDMVNESSEISSTDSSAGMENDSEQ